MDAPDAALFLVRFPEFNQLSTEVVQGMLDSAYQSTPENVWSPFPAQQLEAVYFLAAHLLASRSMQMGHQLGLAPAGALGTGLGATLYGQRRMELEDQLPIFGFVAYADYLT